MTSLPKIARPRSRNTAPAPEDAPPTSTGELLPTATAFDFLNGSFEQVRRARIAQLTSVAAGLAVVLATGAYGVHVYLDSNATAEQRADAELELTVTQQELSEVADVGQLSREDMQSYIDTRGRDLREVTDAELAVVDILAELEASFPAGVELQSVNIDEAGTSDQPADTAADADLLDPTDDDTAPAEQPLPDTSAHVVTLTAQVDTFPALEQLVSQMASSTLFASAPDTSWSGGSDGLSATLTGTLAGDVSTTRGEQIAQQLELTADHPAPANGEQDLDAVQPDTSEES